MDPVIASRQNAALLTDKDDIWADKASSSPFFGHVYLCNIAFRGTNCVPGPLIIDSRIKPQHAPALEEDPAVRKRIEAMAAPGGPLHGLF